MSNKDRMLGSRMKRTGFTLIAIGIVLVIGYCLFGSFTANDCQLTTPDLVGLDIKDAQEFMAGRGNKLLLKDTIVEHNSSVGQIISQSPEPGTKSCDSIKVTINKGIR